ncbi:MAG: enoyl-CoA hydratase-related protein [Sterolibacterium sp.]
MTSTYKDIIYEKRGAVAWITINRPKQLNAVTGDTLKELAFAFEEAGKASGIGVIVLTGAGEKSFCAGGDVNWEKDGGLERLVVEPYLLHVTLSRCPKPVIARVNGYAIGGGNHIAYFSDFTIAADHAIFGQNGPRVGSPANGPIVSYLSHIVGQKRAREIWMLARRYSAKQMLDMGLVNSVVPMAELDAEVERWCDELLALSPTCLRLLKASFVAEFNHVLGQDDAVMRLVLTKRFWEEEQKEGSNAFLEKRKPNFSRFLD